VDQSTQHLARRGLAPVAITGARFTPAYPAPRAPWVPLGVAATLDLALASDAPLAARRRAQPALRAAVGASAALRSALFDCLCGRSAGAWLEVPGAGRWWLIEGAPLSCSGGVGEAPLIVSVDLALLANYLPASATEAVVHVSVMVMAGHGELALALAPLSAAHFVLLPDAA
jgi:hypothetical protein